MIERPVIFLCDMQTVFAKAIHGWPHVVATSSKLVQAASILSIPIVVTTQSRAKLGDTIDELKPSSPLLDVDKTLFSMCLPEVLERLEPNSSVAIVGIESHICVTQTALDLLRHGHRPYVIADAVSSCNAQEVPTALRRLQAAGAQITTSESFVSPDPDSTRSACPSDTGRDSVTEEQSTDNARHSSTKQCATQRSTSSNRSPRSSSRARRRRAMRWVRCPVARSDPRTAAAGWVVRWTSYAHVALLAIGECPTQRESLGPYS